MSENGAPAVPPGRARGIGAWIVVAAGLVLAVVLAVRATGGAELEIWWLVALLVVGLSDAVVGVAFLDRLEGRLAWSLVIGGVAAVTAVVLAISSPARTPVFGDTVWDQLRDSQSWAEPLALGVLAALVPWQLAMRGRHRAFEAVWWTTAALVAATVIGEAVGVRTPGVDVVDVASWLVALSAIGATILLISTWWSGRATADGHLAGWLAAGAAVACLAVVPERLGIDVAGLPGSRAASSVLLLATLPLLVAGVTVQALRDRPGRFHGVAHDVVGWLVLSAAIVAVYTVVVAGVGRLIGGEGSTWLLVATTVIVAISIEPVRRRTSATAERLFWGARDEPLDVVRSIVVHVGADPEGELLPTLAASLRRELRLDRVAIDLATPDGWERVADDGSPTAHERVIDLEQQGTAIGRLTVGWGDGPHLRRRDRRVLEELTAPLGLAVGWARLAAELRQTTVALTSAREEERRRLRRDLHDGLGPALTGVSLGLRSAIRRLEEPTDPWAVSGSRQLLARTADEVDAVVVELKRIVRDLRPTVIDQLGLVGALREFIRGLDGDVAFHLDMPAPDVEFSAAVEVAVYRIVTEAVTNVVRHARAHVCWVRIVAGTKIEIDVVDDGIGTRPQVSHGVGLTAMHERVAELAGTIEFVRRVPCGTELRVRIPAGPR